MGAASAGDVYVVPEGAEGGNGTKRQPFTTLSHCLLYTSDAADDLLCVDLGGRRIIKKKNQRTDLAQHISIHHSHYLSHTR